MSAGLLFPVLEVEQELQVMDKTRLSAVKSFIGQGGTAYTALTIKPDASATPISVLNADTDLQYLDWMYSAFTMNVDSYNNKIDFAEGEGAPVVATVTTGDYSLASLATAIKAALEAASPGLLTYTVSYDTLDRLTISTNSPISLFPETGKHRDNQLLPHIGFIVEDSFQQLKSVTGFRTDHVVKCVTLTMTDGVPSSASVKQYINLYSVAGDMLWSNDSMIAEHEPNIRKYVKDGRTSFLTQHRLAQKEILKWLDKNGYMDVYQKPFTKTTIPRISEVEQWSKFVVLRLIFEGLIVTVDDIFHKKMLTYKSAEVDARSRAELRLDVDGDGKVDVFESISMSSGVVVRR